jgi:hypothetical protein
VSDLGETAEVRGDLERCGSRDAHAAEQRVRPDRSPESILGDEGLSKNPIMDAAQGLWYSSSSPWTTVCLFGVKVTACGLGVHDQFKLVSVWR